MIGRARLSLVQRHALEHIRDDPDSYFDRPSVAATRGRGITLSWLRKHGLVKDDSIALTERGAAWLETFKPRHRQPGQLPQGRHGLGTRFVRSNQRDRALKATAKAVRDFGYGDLSVEIIISHAGISRRSLYELGFDGKRGAFMAAIADDYLELPAVGDDVLIDLLAVAVGKKLARRVVKARPR